VRRAVEAIQFTLEGRGHALGISLPAGPIRLEADPTRLEQVLWNLLSNAAKYTEAGGRIRLEGQQVGGEVVIRVRDTGIGIEREMLPRIFEMFTQVDHRSTRAQGGLGIGLGLVKSLVEMHGGTITAGSDGPGMGSEFVVRLPALPSGWEPPAVVTPRVRATPASGTPHRILVVDDNADAALSLAKLLTRLYGKEVRVAHDGPEALTAVEEFEPEVVLLDIGMPGMDGYEVARQLRRRPAFAGTMLVALTGWGQESDRQESREAGFDRHLVKPVNPEEIRALMTDIEDGCEVGGWSTSRS
jgi:CheY-like chemotaxis protein